MSLPVRRSVDEIITRLTLEPSVWDIFVEGPSDAALVDWILRRHERRGYKVFPVADVSIPSAEMPEEGGERERVIKLADLIAQHFGSGGAPAICLADRDLDVLSSAFLTNRYLVFTDHSSMDVYYFDVNVIERFLSLFVRRRVAEPETILQNLRPVLEEVFLIRAADRRLGLSCGSLSPDRCCEFGSAGLVAFDRDDYVERYLNRNGSLSRLEEFEQTVNSLRSSTDQLLVHGGDFVRLLCAALRPYVANKRVVDPSVAARALMTCVDDEALASSGCFRTILDRLPPPQPW